MMRITACLSATIAVAVSAAALAGPSAATTAVPKLKRIGTVYGGVVGDGARYVAFRGNPMALSGPAQLTLRDTAKGTTRHVTLSAPCGSYNPYGAASGMLLVGSACPPDGIMSEALVNLATGVVRAIPAPPPALAQGGTFVWFDIGRFWLHGEQCSFTVKPCAPAFVNWRTGEYRVLDGTVLDRVPDLDSKTLAKATRFTTHHENDLVLTLGATTRILAHCEVFCAASPVHGDVVTWVVAPPHSPFDGGASSASLYRIRSRRLFTWTRADVPHLRHDRYIGPAAGTRHEMVLAADSLERPSNQPPSSGPLAVYAARLP